MKKLVQLVSTVSLDIATKLEECGPPGERATNEAEGFANVYRPIRRDPTKEPSQYESTSDEGHSHEKRGAE